MGLWRLRHNTERPDILAADQAQPVEALLVGEVNVVRGFVHSSPCARATSGLVRKRKHHRNPSP
jgi:hypothetical protein